MLKLAEGKLIVDEDSIENRYPVIQPGENIKLFVDNEEIEKRTIVTGESKISYEIKGKNKKSQSKTISIDVSEDGMTAYLEIKINPEIDYQVVKIEENNITTITVNEKVINYPEVSKEEIEEKLSQAKINYGIDQDRLEELDGLKKSKRLIIAKGKELVMPQPATVKQINIEHTNKEKYFENYITSVSVGQVFAVFKEATPGENGVTVRGKKVSPPEIEDPEIITGDNVSYYERKNKFIAMESGRPVIEYLTDSIRVTVIQQYKVNGDINRDTGRINYTGDLIVTGSIQDYFGVNIQGILKVKQHINNAEVIVEEDAFVGKNIIGADLEVGISSNEYQIVDKNFNRKVKSFIKHFKQYLDSDYCKKDKIEFDRRFRNLISNSEQFGKIKSDIIVTCQQFLKNKKSEDNQLKDKIKLLHQYLLGYNRFSIESYKDLKKLHKLLENKLYRKQIKGKSNLAAGYIQNSQIISSGDIYIMQTGIYNSTIDAAGNIIGYSKDSFFKGGFYQTGGWFAAGSVGANMGKTKVKVEKGFLAKNVNGQVSVIGPEDQKSFNPGHKYIALKVNEDGLLETQTWPDWFSWRDTIINKNIKSIWKEIHHL